MNFQDKVVETAADFRARAAAFAAATLATAGERATLSADRAAKLKLALSAVRIAGREFRKVARLHVSRFVKQNSALARAAGTDVSALARSTYQQFAQDKPARKSRKVTTARKRAARTHKAKAA
jgi:hypothetical protein